MERSQEIFDRIVTQGEAAIDQFISDRQSEELFLDFKRSSDEGKGKSLSNEDRKNLSKAISGFGNSEGGVIVWGVDCSKGKDGADVAKAKVPLSDPRRFVSWIQGAISGCTVPPHSTVKVASIPSSDPSKGFVITHVPKSNSAPHQVVGAMRYYVRAGSDFVPTPHGVLAGMFGRRPQPHVYPFFLTAPPICKGEAIHAEMGIVIRNDGPGIANDLFLNVMIWSQGGDKSAIACQLLDQHRWSGTSSFGNQHISLISNADVRLPPEAQIQPLKFIVRLAPPFTEELKVDCLIGASSTPPYKAVFQTPANELAKIYADYIKTGTKEDDHRGFIARVFSIPDQRGTNPSS